MGTRSTIGILNDDGTVSSIYCHWDGYLKNNGKLLYEHWTDEVKIRTMIELGNLSKLGRIIGMQHIYRASADSGNRFSCTFYGRDNLDPIHETRALQYGNVTTWMHDAEEYGYLWRDGEWWVLLPNGREALIKLYDALVTQGIEVEKPEHIQKREAAHEAIDAAVLMLRENGYEVRPPA